MNFEQESECCWPLQRSFHSQQNSVYAQYSLHIYFEFKSDLKRSKKPSEPLKNRYSLHLPGPIPPLILAVLTFFLCFLSKNAHNLRARQSYTNRISTISLQSTTRQNKRNTARSNKRSIPRHIQKQLAQDIEASGGIQSVSITNILNRKPDVYGEPNTSLRRSLENRAQYWKNFLRNGHPEDYLLVLSDFGVQAAEASHRSLSSSSQAPEPFLDSEQSETPPPPPPVTSPVFTTQAQTMSRQLTFRSPEPVSSIAPEESASKYLIMLKMICCLRLFFF